MVGIVGRVRRRVARVDEKNVMFLFCLFVCMFVTLWNYEVCDNGNSIIFKQLWCHCIDDSF